MNPAGGLAVVRVTMPEEWGEVAALMRTYLAGLPFEVDFQDVDVELADVAAYYGGDDGGAWLLREAGSPAVGTVALHRFDATRAELKRMYVTPEARGTGGGRALAVAAIGHARALGYDGLLLDTVASLTSAIRIYESLGFVAIDAYRHNPRPDARYFHLDLSAQP